MEIKIYREPENEHLLIDEEALKAYNELAAELGLCTQEAKEEEHSPNVYICLNSGMQKQLFALCPSKAKIEDYKRTTIPLEVLQVYKLAKNHNMFEGFEIWYDDVQPDPMLIAWKWQSEEAKAKGYSWLKERYLLARWGDCALELPELLEKGTERIIQEIKDKALEMNIASKSMLENPELYMRKILNGTFQTPCIDIKANNTIY